MKNSLTVLMFHALYDINSDLYEADLYYAQSVKDFKNLVNVLDMQGFLINSLRNSLQNSNFDEQEICFTFDDGHISNYTEATPILHNKLSSADFFINSAYVGNKGYIDWQGLSDMNKLGMSIQSHGHHHNYFDELDKQGITNELRLSKQLIEDNVGSEVSIFAPPGGRITPLVREIALDLDYTAIAASRPGYWTKNTDIFDIPRVPVLGSTSLDQIYSWANLNKYHLNKILAKYYITMSGKKVLGNKLYDKFRSRILGE